MKVCASINRESNGWIDLLLTNHLHTSRRINKHLIAVEMEVEDGWNGVFDDNDDCDDSMDMDMVTMADTFEQALDSLESLINGGVYQIYQYQIRQRIVCKHYQLPLVQ